VNLWRISWTEARRVQKGGSPSAVHVLGKNLRKIGGGGRKIGLSFRLLTRDSASSMVKSIRREGGLPPSPLVEPQDRKVEESERGRRKRDNDPKEKGQKTQAQKITKSKREEHVVFLHRHVEGIKKVVLRRRKGEDFISKHGQSNCHER